MKWDAVPVKDVAIDHEALEFLREHALEKNRLTAKAVAVSDETLIRNLQVLTKDGEYTRAAAMLFSNPEDVVFGSYIRIGLPEIKATDKYVTVTIRVCRKYMELLNTDNTTTNLGTNSFTNLCSNEGAGEEADPQKKVILFCEKPRTKNEMQDYLGIKSDRYIRQAVIQPLLSDGRLARTIPEKPSSPKQKYVSTKTELGRAQAIMANKPVHNIEMLNKTEEIEK